MQLSTAAVIAVTAMLSGQPSETTVLCQGFAYNLARQLVAVKQTGLTKQQVLQTAKEWGAEQKVDGEAMRVVVGMIKAFYDGKGEVEAMNAFVRSCVRDNTRGLAI